MLNKTFSSNKQKLNKLEVKYKKKNEWYNHSNEELLKIKNDIIKNHEDFEKSLKNEYDLSVDKSIKNFDLIRYSQDELISKLQNSIKDQGKIISNYSFQVIESLRKISELNNTIILQQKELIDRDKQLDVSKQ